MAGLDLFFFYSSQSGNSTHNPLKVITKSPFYGPPSSCLCNHVHYAPGALQRWKQHTLSNTGLIQIILMTIQRENYHSLLLEKIILPVQDLNLGPFRLEHTHNFNIILGNHFQTFSNLILFIKIKINLWFFITLNCFYKISLGDADAAFKKFYLLF